MADMMAESHQCQSTALPGPPVLLIGSLFRLKFHNRVFLKSLLPHATLSEVYTEHHPIGDYNCGMMMAQCGLEERQHDAHPTWVTSEDASRVTIGDISARFPGVSGLVYECKQQTVAEVYGIVDLSDEEELVEKPIQSINAVLGKQKMSMTCFKETKSAGVKDGLNRKKILHNDIIGAFFLECEIGCQSQSAAKGILETLVNALWYIDQHHSTINNAAERNGSVQRIPAVFDKFSGYNDFQKKKKKRTSLSSVSLKAHSDALFSIAMKSVMRSSVPWVLAADAIRELAECCQCYANYLDSQNKQAQINQKAVTPVRSLSKDLTCEFRRKTVVPSQRYIKLDTVMKQSPVNSPVFFDESVHLENPFINRQGRYDFLKNLHLSVPLDMYRFSPGGSVVTSVCLVRVNDSRTKAEEKTQTARMVNELRTEFREFHTREQRRAFKAKIENLATVPAAVAEFIYKDLCMDAASASSPVTQERLRLISLGDTDLLTDLRKVNPGRPGGNFETFFEKLAEEVERVTVADERRHGEAHLSSWISLEDMVNTVAQKLEDDVPVPSLSLVRLQFVPRNKYSHAALRFTGRVKVQYKIQTRQLRASHEDQHYCAALLKYFKHHAIELGDRCSVFFMDDKAKVPIGEPGLAVSTGVRGKKTIVPTEATLSAADHDMTKASITPSVILECDVPDSVVKSFVQGQLHVCVNDSVFQTSNPFRHGVMLCKTFRMGNDMPKVVMKYSDGGTDHRNTLEAVQCSLICIFKELDLDMLIAGRCAPGNSYVNPAERCMSVLNLGLQNCATERQKLDEAAEKKLKACNSMSAIREKAQKDQTIKETWSASVEPVKQILRGRFGRLKLSDKPVAVMHPITDQEIEDFKGHLRTLFPTLRLDKLQKVHTSKCAEYEEWKEKHCRSRHYVFQIRKCDDRGCCSPPVYPDALTWLPDPTLDVGKEHFMPYTEAILLDTTESDRPSKAKPTKIQVRRSRKRIRTEDAPVETAPVHDTAPVETAPDENEEVDRDVIQIDSDTDMGEENMNPEQVEEDVQDISGEESEGTSSENVALATRRQSKMLFTAQCARMVVECTECRKPRVLYSQHKLTERQQISLIVGLEQSDYTCGAPILPDTHPLYQQVVPREGLKCNIVVETTFYTSSLGRKDICASCGAEDGIVCAELLKEYKTVLPLCDRCKDKGEKPSTYLPYGYGGK